MSVRDRSVLLLLLPLIAACNSSRAPTDAPAKPSPSASASALPAAVLPEKPPPPTTREGSAVTRAVQDDALFVADEDHRALHIVPFPIADDTPVTTVPMPGRPAQVITSRDRVLVTIREMPEGGGGLLIFKREGKLGLKETARVKLTTDAWGIALAPDESFVAVTSAWGARVSIVDLSTANVRAVLPVSREPRGITILPDGKRAYVSHLVGSAITRISDIDGASPTATKLEFPAGVLRGSNGQASLGYATVSSPRGERIFFPRHAHDADIGDWYGSSAIDVWVPAVDKPLAPPPNPQAFKTTKLIAQMEGDTLNPSTGLKRGATEFVQPRAAVYRQSERTILVVSEGKDEIIEFDALIQDPVQTRAGTYQITKHENKLYDIATTCGAPSGIALSRNEQVAYIYCRTTDELMALRLHRKGTKGKVAPPVVVRLVEPKNTPEDESYRLGRALYFNATDSVTSESMACAGCHPDGRDDGHVWHETHFKSESFGEDFVNFMSGPDSFEAIAEKASSHGAYGCGGMVVFDVMDAKLDADERMVGMGVPRQTPMIAGRVAAEGPYGWHGESETLADRLVGGFGLHRWRLGSGSKDNKLARAGHLIKFLREGLVPPETMKRELTEQEKQGKTIFESEKAQCAKCHVPGTGYTDRIPISVGDPPELPGFAKEENIAFKTPSLLWVGGTAPYFHDARFATLAELVEKNGDKMGKTSDLSAEEKKALVAYLETL